MIVVVDDMNSLIAVPREIAICPDCGASLNALPNEMDSVTPGIDLWKVFVPILFCQSGEGHGDQMTNEWWDTYAAVGEWFETILIKCGLGSVLWH